MDKSHSILNNCIRKLLKICIYPLIIIAFCCIMMKWRDNFKINSQNLWKNCCKCL